MDRDFRRRFNAAWSPELHERVQQDLGRRLGCEVPFPVAETPLFLDRPLMDRFARTADEVMAELTSPAYLAKAEEFLPDWLQGPGRAKLPQFAVIDFAVTRAADGTLEPRVVELQGFPSLYCFQILLADVWATHLAGLDTLPSDWRLFFSNRNRHEALSMLRRTILGRHSSDEVCLVDFAPEGQKTRPDFAATRHWFGIDAVCVTKLIRDGDKLFRDTPAGRKRIRRIYHRIVFDELDKMGAKLPFAFGEALDVEWVPHPAWFYLWSKTSLLHLKHACVPKTTLLSEYGPLPADLSELVLKPLYSFAGAGVNVAPNKGDIEAIPKSVRDQWVLQEKIEYGPAFENVDGDPVKAEIRMMYVRPDDQEELTLLLNLVRLSRGEMIGVDHNRMPWTGASVGIWADGA